MSIQCTWCRASVSLDEFQSESGPVVVVLSGDVQVVDASFGAVDTLEDDDDGDTLIGRLAGEVFGGENAERPVAVAPHRTAANARSAGP